MKSAYYVARKILEGNSREESFVRDMRALLWKKMWHLNIPANVRFFCLKAMYGCNSHNAKFK